MTEPTIHGHTNTGRPITDELIDELVAEAEAGYDVDQLIARRGKRGRPLLGSAPATVESVRLDPALAQALAARAADEGATPSALIREALRRFLGDEDRAPAPPAPHPPAPRGPSNVVAPRGRDNRAQQALVAITAHPGITTAELAASLGVSRSYLYRVLARLEREAKVAKRGMGYHPASGAATASPGDDSRR